MSAPLMIALYDFDAQEDPEIAMKKGDHVEILDMDPALNGWAYARLKRSGEEGYVPVSYLGSHINRNKGVMNKNMASLSNSTSPKPNNNRRNNYHKMNYNNNQNNNNNNNNNNNPLNDNNNNQNNNNSTNNNQSNSNQSQQNNTNSNQNQIQNQHQNVNNNNQANNIPDNKQIICSFHRDFIPEIDDLYKYFQMFGKVTNEIEIEYDPKKVPLAKIKFQNAQSVDKVCDKGNRQQIPSGAQNGTIHIRVYRSMQDYINNTQRSNRGHGQYKKHTNSRRGSAF